jgi:hypothetical protein
MHNPYGQFPADNSRSAAFAVAADMSPYFDNGDIIQASMDSLLRKIDPAKPFSSQLYNSLNHKSYGQTVLYADGYISWEQCPDVGVKYDNIYTFWLTKTNSEPNELNKRIGQSPKSRSPENDAKSEKDSFLVI